MRVTLIQTLILAIILWSCTHKSQTLEYFIVDLKDQDEILKTLEIELNEFILLKFSL